MATTLKQAQDSTTVEHLGTDADEHDLVAYREALARAWPHQGLRLADGVAVDEDYAERVKTSVLEGRAGLDEHLRDWTKIATARRTLKAVKEKQEIAAQQRFVVLISGTGAQRRVGSAWTNADGSISIFLDALPLDGKLTLAKEVAR